MHMVRAIELQTMLCKSVKYNMFPLSLIHPTTTTTTRNIESKRRLFLSCFSLSSLEEERGVGRKGRSIYIL